MCLPLGQTHDPFWQLRPPLQSPSSQQAPLAMQPAPQRRWPFPQWQAPVSQTWPAGQWSLVQHSWQTSPQQRSPSGHA
jgi:hypothetical protein